MSQSHSAWLLISLLAAHPAWGAVPEADVQRALARLANQFPASEQTRLAAGVRQAARLWTVVDGSAAEFEKFCGEEFVVGPERDLLLDRFEAKLEALRGHFTALGLELRREMDEDRGELTPAEQLRVSVQGQTLTLTEME